MSSSDVHQRYQSSLIVTFPGVSDVAYGLLEYWRTPFVLCACFWLGRSVCSCSWCSSVDIGIDRFNPLLMLTYKASGEQS